MKFSAGSLVGNPDVHFQNMYYINSFHDTIQNTSQILLELTNNEFYANVLVPSLTTI